MAVSANGTHLKFNDNTTQTTAAVSGFSNMFVNATPGSSTFTVPPSTTKIKVTVVGGGGSGGAGGSVVIQGGGEPVSYTSWDYPGRGGGGGGGAIKIFPVSGGTVIPYTVGGSGGSSSFGPYAPGSPAPSVTVSATAGSTGGNGGTGTNGDLNFTGGQGMAAAGGVYVSHDNPLAGGQTILGSYGRGGTGAIPTVGPGSAGTAGVIVVEY